MVALKFAYLNLETAHVSSSVRTIKVREKDNIFLGHCLVFVSRMFISLQINNIDSLSY